MFFGNSQQGRIDRTGKAGLLFLFLDGEDVGRPLHTGQQVRPVFGLEQIGQRIDTLGDEGEIVLLSPRKHRVDQIMPRT